MRISAIAVVGFGALLLGCSSGAPQKMAGGSGGSDEGGSGGSDQGGSGGSAGGASGSSGSGGSGGASGSGGSGGSDVTPDAGAQGGSGGTDVTPDSGTTDDMGAAGSGGAGGMGGTGGTGGPPDMTGLTKIFDGTTTMGWTSTPPGMFNVANGALVASGKGRGAFATDGKYGHYRILFSLKPGGTGGHAPTVLVFCLYPGKDALGGIQFQPPNGGHWDYRPGKNDAGGTLFTKIGAPGPAGPDGFFKCEIVANNMTGEAKMACGGKDVLHFKDMTAAGMPSPFALQTHNAGISDQYKDFYVQDNITDDNYITAK